MILPQTNNKIYIYIIYISILVRFIGITLPPLEVSHHWRQALSNMTALDYYENGLNILEPKDRFSGAQPGLAPMEFPLLPSLIWVFSLTFQSFQDWYGRLIVLLFFATGAYSAFKTIKKYLSEETAYLSIIILSFSLWMPFSRKVMPDIPAFSIMLTSIFLFSQIVENKKMWKIFLCLTLCTLGLLTKISAVIFLPCYFFILRAAKPDIPYKTLLTIGLVLFILPALYWYFVHVPDLAKKNPSGHFFMGKSVHQGFMELKENPQGLLKRLLINPLHYIGGSLFLIFFIKFRSHVTETTLFFSAFLILIPLMAKTGLHFIHHDYYVLPLVPFISLCTATFLAQIRNSYLKGVILIGIIAEGIINFYPDIRIHPEMHVLVKLDQKLDSLHIQSPVAVNGDLNPCAMMYTGRYGWSFNNSELQKISNKKMLINQNCQAIIILRKTFEKDTKMNDKLIYGDEDFAIFRPVNE